MSKDTLSELLRAVRLRGAIFFYVEGISPWVAETPRASELVNAILPGVEHMIEYHVVTHGSCWGALSGETPVRLEAGDVIMFPQGDAHVISSAPGLRATEIDPSVFFVPKPAQLPYVLTQRGEQTTTAQLDGGGSDRAKVVCGFLGCDARPFNPLLAALPRLLHIPGAAAKGGWIGHFIEVAVEEANHKRPGGEAVLERLSEMMFVEAVRRHLDRLPSEQTGWLAGLRDRFVGRALAFLHERPQHRWTIDELGDAVGLSRSALHERFAHFVGQPPMQYLTHWRMQVASGLLLQTTMNIASIALEAGYDSEAAFSRAFKRLVGMPPAAWRRQRTSAVAHAAPAAVERTERQLVGRDLR
ncbi:MAG TPA: AraC family transcriptional regulator [Casimicrobiaceae bacterium]|nr:AraC family transcriptional regulator [Casimicrobiaceae bacterium]